MKLSKIILSLSVLCWSGWVHASHKEVFINDESLAKAQRLSIDKDNFVLSLTSNVFNTFNMATDVSDDIIDIHYSSVNNASQTLLDARHLLSGKSLTFDEISRRIFAGQSILSSGPQGYMCGNPLNITSYGSYSGRLFESFVSQNFITLNVKKVIRLDGCLLQTPKGTIINSINENSLISKFIITPSSFSYISAANEAVQSETTLLACYLDFTKDFYNLKGHDATVQVVFNKSRVAALIEDHH